jgi:hypothetical protein
MCDVADLLCSNNFHTSNFITTHGSHHHFILPVLCELPRIDTSVAMWMINRKV